jgi:DsbC/DsbD-like thiol-disulfide interchange protein
MRTMAVPATPAQSLTCLRVWWRKNGGVAHAPQGIAAKAVRFGLLIQHKPHWRTYWRNPGESGLPTTLGWQLPEGVQVGEIEWPMPKQLPIGPLMNYGYEDQLLLPVGPCASLPTSTLPALDAKLRADWFVCKEECIPESGEFSLKVPSKGATASHANLFTDAQARLPQVVEGHPMCGARLPTFPLLAPASAFPLSVSGLKPNEKLDDGCYLHHPAAVDERRDGPGHRGKTSAGI